MDTLLPPDWIRPDYAGRGFANIPATVGALLGTQVGTLPPLADPLWEPLAAGVERVVLILLDGVGWNRLGWTDPDFLTGWRAAGGIAAPLTAVCPSTTAVATTTLWTGAAPAAHGLAGTLLHLPEMGGICHLLFFRHPLSHHHGELADWGLDPHAVVAVPGVAEWLARAAIPTSALIAQSIIGSSLSQIHYRGVSALQGHIGASDFWLRLREMVEAQAARGRRGYVAAYWGQVDTLGHLYGPDDASWPSEWRTLRFLLEEEFLARLSPAACRGTLLILTADHGQIPLTPVQNITLQQHPDLAAMLATLPAGDPRHVYLWPRPGARAEIERYVSERLPDFRLFDRDALLEAGLYGPTIWPEVRLRMGELVMIAAGQPHFTGRPSKQPFLGMHSALLPDEALVPWLARRLG